jgi:hypothetical protein
VTRRRPPRRAGSRIQRPRKAHPLTWTGHLLDQFSVRDLRQWSHLNEAGQKFHWDFYAALQHQRTTAATDIRKALLGAASGPFPFQRWRRIVDYRYSLAPLSTVGSVTDPGGRFNIGAIDVNNFPVFNALYLAANEETSMAEKFGEPDATAAAGMSATDLALATRESFASLSVSGELESIVDLREPRRLQALVDIIGAFKLPADLFVQSKKIGFGGPGIVRSTPELADAVTSKGWRQFPMQFDVPSTSQIFGQLVRSAGIEGIVWPSQKGSDLCLAAFPDNLTGSSYVTLDDDPPSQEVPRRMDATTWKLFV